MATEAEYKAAVVGLKEATDDVKKIGETLHSEIKTLGAASAETKATADKALAKMTEIAAQISDMEQKQARRGSGNEIERKSLGQHVIDNEAVKAMDSQTRGRAVVKLETKDITSAAATVGAGVSASNSLVTADRVQGIIMLPDRRLTIRDLLTPGSTNSSSIEYGVETGFTNNADMVPEGATKPYSDLTFDLKRTSVATIAHLFKASRQILDDAPQLQSIIDGRGRYGLDYKEEGQFLYGNGQGSNLLGIMPQATALTVPTGITAPTTPIDRIRLAILQAVLAEYPATGIVLHPIDWFVIETEKDTQGRYIIGNPAGQIAPTLWGLPVVATQAITQNNFLAGAFRLGAQIFDRMETEVLISTENATDFEQNKVSIRFEKRVGLAVYRPQAFVTGTVTPPSS